MHRVVAFMLALLTSCALTLKPDGPDGDPPPEKKESSSAMTAVIVALAAAGVTLLVYIIAREPKE